MDPSLYPGLKYFWKTCVRAVHGQLEHGIRAVHSQLEHMFELSMDNGGMVFELSATNSCSCSSCPRPTRIHVRAVLDQLVFMFELALIVNRTARTWCSSCRRYPPSCRLHRNKLHLERVWKKKKKSAIKSKWRRC